MANKNPKNQFLPGNTFGKGRPKMPKELLAAVQMSKEEMTRAVIETRRMTPVQIKKLDMNKLPMGVCVIIAAYVSGDYNHIKIYEDRVYGKAKETVDINAGVKIVYLDKQDENL